MESPLVPPYVFRKAAFLHSIDVGYWVTLFIVFDGFDMYSFFRESDAIDNASEAYDMGYYVTKFSKEILVTPNHHSNIYNEIFNYVSSSDTH